MIIWCRLAMYLSYCEWYMAVMTGLFRYKPGRLRAKYFMG